MNSSSETERDWNNHFPIQSEVDLDFVIGQTIGWPVGMQRRSPAEFRRRILAAAQSYIMQLKSIDYTLKQYVKPDQYDADPFLFGDVVSDYLKQSTELLKTGLKLLHTPEPEYGRVGAELTLYKFPEMLDAARILSNRGLFLEVLPILRLCLEMTAWAVAVFDSNDEKYVTRQKAQSCLTILRDIYPSAGRIYGYISKFTHWEKTVHSVFLHIEPGRVSVIQASTTYRAMSTTLCLILLDVFLEVVRHLYGESAQTLLAEVRGDLHLHGGGHVHHFVHQICELTKIDEIKVLESFLELKQ